MTDYQGIPRNLPQTFRCRNHPDREGIGICVSCRSVVCVECSTKIDRMNYCIRCLESARLASTTRRQEDPKADTAMGISLLVVSFLGAAGIFGVLGLMLAVLRQ